MRGLVLVEKITSSTACLVMSGVKRRLIRSCCYIIHIMLKIFKTGVIETQVIIKYTYIRFDVNGYAINIR